MLIAHQVLVGAVLPRRELEVVPSEEQKQEEGQHEELPVPHRHQEDLKGREGGEHDSVNAKPITLQSWIQLPNLGRLDGRTKYVMDLTTILNLMKSSTDCKASEIYSRWQ